MKNRIASIALTGVMILGCMITNIDFNMNTVCADPYNIEISVETKEISIDEIPEDRLVPLTIRLSNVPEQDIYFIDISYKIDDKIANWTYHCELENAIPNITTKIGHMDNCTFYIKADTVFYDEKKIPSDLLYTLFVFIPPEVKEGDYYEISPIPYCYADSYQLDTSFALESNKEEEFGPSNFTYYGGGIKIRSSQPEQPTSNDPVPTPDNENYIFQNENSNNQSPINNDTNDEITTVTSSETIYSTVSTVSSTKSTTALSPITLKKSTESETNVIINTESLNTSEVTKEKSSNSNFIILILVLLCLLIMVVALIIIFKRSKKDSNDDQH